MNEEELAYFQMEGRYYEQSRQSMSYEDHGTETYTDLDDPEEALKDLYS